ncbi:MAG: hypothetical protein VX768_20725 [Planctomycetota bacterium]|nr:hypothetical protein [Planctomycetota bacterium]
MKSFEKLEILRAAVSVVAIDGEVSEQERALIDKLATEIGVGQASRQAMIARGTSDPEFCEEMFRVLKTDPGETMMTLFHAAMVDGVLDESEVKVLWHFAAKLGMQENTFSALVEKAKSMTRG